MSRFRLPNPNPMITMSKLIWATNPATLSSPPTAMAIVRSSPLRWKKRMFTATRAAVDGTARFTNVIAYSSNVSRPYGIGMGVASDVLSAPANRGVWPMISARIKMGTLAPLIASMIDSRPTSWIDATMVENTIASRIHMTTLPTENRRIAWRSCSSAPTAAIIALRRSSMSTLASSA